MRNGIAAIVFSCLFALSSRAVFADDAPPPSDSYFISMRSPDVDASPRYAGAVLDPTDDMSEPISGCDGETYYVTTDDKAAVMAAFANGNTVQLQDGPPGAAAADTSVICLMQASP
jgi:hypothetical protein